MEKNTSSTVVHYANVLPGMGKTHWALDAMVSCIQEKKDIILYVAPTTNLLDEVYAALLFRLGPTARKSVRMVASQGTYVTVSSMFVGLPVRDQVMAVLDGRQAVVKGESTVYKQCALGTVVLITHESFLNLPHNPVGDSSLRHIKRRPQVKVIFDEARKCLLKELEFRFSRHVMDTLFKEFDLHRVPNSDFHSLRLRRTLSYYEFKEMFLGCSDAEKHAAESLWSVLDSLMVTPSHAVYFKTEAGVDSASRRHFNAHLLMIPQRLFHGWKSVILLSAFFPYSQMFHLLSRNVLPSSCSPNVQRLLEAVDIDNGPWLRMKDVSVHVVSSARSDAVRARYAATTITYLSEHTSFSKHQLMNGVLVHSSFYSEEGQARLTAAVEAFRRLGKGRRLSLRYLCEDAFINKTSITTDVRKVLKNIPLFKANAYRPLQFYAKAATYLSAAWYKKVLKQVPKPLPMLTNVGGGTHGEPKYWEAQVMSHCEPDEVIKMPFGVHGLNKFKGYHTVAYLASLNPTPLAKSLFGHLCPDYNPDLDHTVDHAVQAALRISMRNTRDTTPPLIIVTDKTLAVAIQAHLCGLPKIIPPQELVPSLPALDVLALSSTDARNTLRHKKRMNSDMAYAEKHRSTKARLMRKSRESNKERDAFVRANSKHHSKVAALRVFISRAKKLGRPHTKQAAELAALLPLYKAETSELRKDFARVPLGDRK